MRAQEFEAERVPAGSYCQFRLGVTEMWAITHSVVII
jgi:hypothetical protein